jgi:hypothetical protein
MTASKNITRNILWKTLRGDHRKSADRRLSHQEILRRVTEMLLGILPEGRFRRCTRTKEGFRPGQLSGRGPVLVDADEWVSTRFIQAAAEGRVHRPGAADLRGRGGSGGPDRARLPLRPGVPRVRV